MSILVRALLMMYVAATALLWACLALAEYFHIWTLAWLAAIPLHILAAPWIWFVPPDRFKPSLTPAFQLLNCVLLLTAERVWRVVEAKR